MPHLRISRPLLYGGLGALVCLGYVVAAGSVPKRVTARDLKAITFLQADEACSRLNSFEGQLHCVTTVQHAVQASVANRHCAKHGERIEPLDFLQRGYGCCFDRSRFIEKALEHYGLKTRHAFLFDTSEHGLLSVIIPRSPSHAASEVHTSRGWMGVDSDYPFILITHDRRPLTFDDLSDVAPEMLTHAPVPRPFFSHPLLVTYGLYSRHGRFYGPKLPAPEINYPDLLRYNF